MSVEGLLDYFRGFYLERGVRFGDVLTSLTIGVSVTGLLISWYKDRTLRKRERADSVRRAAAETLGRLDSWSEWHDAMYDAVDPLFVKSSRMLEADWDWLSTRDWLWRKMQEHRTSVVERSLSGDFQLTYAEIVMFQPAFRPWIVARIADLRSCERTVYAGFVEGCQTVIRTASQEWTREEYTPAMLGNQLRGIAERSRIRFRDESQPQQQELSSVLESLVELPDKLLASPTLAPEDVLQYRHRRDQSQPSV